MRYFNKYYTVTAIVEGERVTIKETSSRKEAAYLLGTVKGINADAANSRFGFRFNVVTEYGRDNVRGIHFEKLDECPCNGCTHECCGWCKAYRAWEHECGKYYRRSWTRC